MCPARRDVHGYVLWCRKGHFSNPIPQAKPRSVSLDLHRLSLEQPSAPLPLRPRYSTYLISETEKTYRLVHYNNSPHLLVDIFRFWGQMYKQCVCTKMHLLFPTHQLLFIKNRMCTSHIFQISNT